MHGQAPRLIMHCNSGLLVQTVTGAQLVAQGEGDDGGAELDAANEGAGRAAAVKPNPKTRAAAAAAPAEPEAPTPERPPAEALADWQRQCSAWMRRVEELLDKGTAKVGSTEASQNRAVKSSMLTEVDTFWLY